jgi:hypothetical protein
VLRPLAAIVLGYFSGNFQEILLEDGNSPYAHFSDIILYPALPGMHTERVNLTKSGIALLFIFKLRRLHLPSSYPLNMIMD